MKNMMDRPYWHVDLKWIFGILFAFFLGLSLFTLLLLQITNKENGVEIMATGLAVAYSGGDINRTSDFEAAKEKAGPDNIFYPIPNSTISINLNEYENLGAKEARLKFWRQFAEMIYNEDFAKYANTPEQLDKIEKDTTFLRIASANSNNIVKKAFLINLALAFIALIFLIRFSYSWGKLMSVGLILILVSFPGAIFMLFISILKQPPVADPNNLGPFGRYSPIASEVAPIVSKVGLQIYGSALLFGLILFIASLVVKKVMKKKQSKGDI